MIRRNPQGDYPKIDETAYIDPTAVVIGNVEIGKNVFVAPGAVVRADEQKSSINIADNCSIQDRVVIHALGNSLVTVGKNTSLSHGCIIHGPCEIGNDCFIGFGSVVFRATIGDGTCVKHLAVVEGVDVLSEIIVESHSFIGCEDDTKNLANRDKNTKDFMERVVEANLDLLKGYKNE